MNNNQNKLTKFWQELKRRKVVRVSIIYASVAFILLQLIDILVDPLHLPEWVMTFFVVLLLVGFPIVIILAWIFDVTPEGIEVTPPLEQKSESHAVPHSRRKVRIQDIVIGILLVVVVILAIPKIFNAKSNPVIERSIAILPFIDDSGNPDNTSFGNGLMEEVRINLQKVKDLTVASRTSVEKYRGIGELSIPEIAEDLNVNYIVEGSGQMYDNAFRLRIQLIEGRTDNHLWAEPYEGEIKNSKDVFVIQSNIAKSIAKELNAAITPEEKLLIEKEMTTSLSALDSYQKGRDLLFKYLYNDGDRDDLSEAEELYNTALNNDPTFAAAYSGLAYVYWEKFYWNSYFSDNFLDSVFILAEKALSLDPQLEDAYFIRGKYFREKNEISKSLDDINRSLEINPNYWEAYAELSQIYSWISVDLVKALENVEKAVKINRGTGLSNLYHSMAFIYAAAGFEDKAKQFSKNALELDQDSVKYYQRIGTQQQYFRNYQLAQKYLEQAYKIDPKDKDLLRRLGSNYLFLKKYKESLEYYLKWDALLKQLGERDLGEVHRIGLAYSKTGNQAQSEIYFKIQEQNCLESIERDRDFSQNKRAYYDLAAVYAFEGKKEEAYKYLNEFEKIRAIPLWWLNLMKDDELFDSIRQEDRFQNILLEMEIKYQAEHERVLKWLQQKEEI